MNFPLRFIHINDGVDQHIISPEGAVGLPRPSGAGLRDKLPVYILRSVVDDRLLIVYEQYLSFTEWTRLNITCTLKPQAELYYVLNAYEPVKWEKVGETLQSYETVLPFFQMNLTVDF